MSNGQLSIEELYLRAGIKVGAPGESATAIPGTSNLQELPSMSDVASYLESGVFNITEEDLKGSKNDILNMFKSKLMPIGVDVEFLRKKPRQNFLQETTLVPVCVGQIIELQLFLILKIYQSS
jgi:hypothetical protein